MNKPEPNKGRVIGLQERPLGRTVLRTYRAKADLDDVVPNERQPRLGPKEDEELQRQIDDNEGLFEPLLVEPHPDQQGKFRIIDGERRWANSRILVEHGKTQYRQIPIEVTDRTLSEEDRLRVWIYIHRQRKEWDAKEKEMVAYRLIQLVGRASAANMLGISFKELDKLIEVFELSERFKGLKDDAASLTWARELLGVNKKLLSPTVIDAVVDKVARKRITNSKDLRKLRAILPDPVANAHFMTRDGDLESAMMRLRAPAPKKEKGGLVSDLDTVVDSVKKVPWATLNELKKDPEFLKKIDEATTLLNSLRTTLSS
ncbi:ParB N-terminal domain-containing protein [Bradyrhizobium sp. CCGUVB4N]|uniref:ParB/RepB/Spo0J family partition protein n=1 Tax=Bradyrhizobium sp. CCGUVB4N TaxID=2949631 RepID=UPI0020B40CDB|nr:ParB N-terminal domain-containing protein [Bradyrhizobium sp. CCGUVB4N]MCP3381205.1 ParB N-terminal domain-containing protein [Bradyrhizobium sp. CCGUVB4N]